MRGAGAFRTSVPRGGGSSIPLLQHALLNEQALSAFSYAPMILTRTRFFRRPSNSP
jgi:hypothetical protein